ncbi:MAG: hypothetical protein ACTHV4_08765 [Canibacter sp.]
MTQRRTWLRTTHRAHTLLTVMVVITLLALNLAGKLSSDMALRLFLVIEVPLLLVFLATTALRFRHLARSTDAEEVGFLDRLEIEEPLLRPVVVEFRAFGSLCLAVARKRQVPQKARPFGYTKGSMTFPAVMIAVSLAELVIVHMLVPWEWLQIVLLVLTVWGVLFFLGYFATRVVHPHFVTNEALHLRWGHPTVLSTPLTNIASVTPHTSHAHTQPEVQDERLILTQSQSTNVRIRFSEPVATAAPVSKKNRPADFHAREVQLYVDDPEGFLQALRPLPDEVTT